VSTATLYRHFPSKHHLLVATLSKWLEHFDGGVDVDCVGLQAPFERLWFVVDALYASLSRNPLLAEAMARAYAVADATVAAQVELVRLHMTEIFADALGDDPTGRNTDIGALLADVWAANVLAVSLNRISGAELRRRLAATVRVLSTRAADGPG
jgi:AcrR family transcriptional regulator